MNQLLEDTPQPDRRGAGNSKTSIKFYTGGAIIAVTVVGLLLWATNRPGSTAFYLTTSEVSQQGATTGAEEVRVNGNVVEGTVQREGLETSFTITDGSTQVIVHTDRPLPDAFRDDPNTEVVARGSYDGEIFNASEVLAKCPSKFKAKA
jgi:cytochrome c-type biogenesis protein CcmE